MQKTFPTLCGSYAVRPSTVGVQYHNAGYRALGLDYTYVAFYVGEDDLKGAVQAIRALHMRGVGITMPHKTAIIPYLDALSPEAEATGSVNTVVNDDGKLTGYNMDWIAAKEALEAVTSLDGKDAVLVGAGGVARSFAYLLATGGARVRVYNRTVEQAAALVDEFGLGAAHALDVLPQVGDYDILINATSVGYHNFDDTVVPQAVLRPDTVVMDVVAEPMETLLMAQAKAKGAQCVHGHQMRLLQAVKQFELYTGVPAPVEVMREALERATSRH
jgi:shikimate dehydrogenase